MPFHIFPGFAAKFPWARKGEGGRANNPRRRSPDYAGPTEGESPACDEGASPPVGTWPGDGLRTHLSGDPDGERKTAEIEKICEEIAALAEEWKLAARSLCEIEGDILRLRTSAARVVFGVSVGSMVRVPGIDFGGRRPHNSGHVYRVTKVYPSHMFPDVSDPETKPAILGTPISPPIEPSDPGETMLGRLWEIDT